MSYKKLFDPPLEALFGDPGERGPGDRRDGRVYVYDDRTILAVNVALATDRPLLICGPAGSGKSSLAPAVVEWARASGKNWRLLDKPITARAEARDLLWTFDSVRRLRDAQANELQEPARYVEPGVLWKAFDPAGAGRFGSQSNGSDPIEEGRAVVLLDEIDKADPDVPNDLLVPLGSFEFPVTDTGETVKAVGEPPLIVLTTNDERELSRPFVRRCVVLALEPPSRERLVQIARLHFPRGSDELFEEVAARVEDLTATDRDGLTASTAEYLDAVEACMELGVDTSSDEWAFIAGATLEKRIAPSS
jgi:MoxR-like ATPase